MSDVTPYTHFFYFPTAEAARAAAEELSATRDLLTDSRKAVSRDAFVVLAAGPRDWDDEQLFNDLETLAKRYGGEYDGGESGWLLV